MLFFRKLIFSIKFLPIDIILFFKGIKVKVAEDAESLEKIFRLRKNVYEEKQYAVFDKNCVSWQDEYDNHAINIGAFRGGEAIGAVRMVHPSGLCFPIENYFNLNEKIPENCVEISKLVVKKDFRGGKRIIMIGLMKKALNLSFENKINNWAFFMTKGLCDSFKKMGVDFVGMKTFPDTGKEITNKAAMSGYFKQDIRPYFLDLGKMVR